MSLVAKATGGGGDFTPAPEGTHAARCVRVIDLGTQPGSQMYPAEKHKVLIGWELPEELHDFKGEQLPFLVMKRYTMSLHEKAGLRHDLESWRGRKFTDDELAGFDLKNIAGVPCMITITHVKKESSTYTNIQAVTAPPKGLTVAGAVNPIVYYQIEDGASEAFGGFSDNLQATIRNAPEWEGPADSAQQAGSEDGNPGFGDDDIPF